jgi:hypothetical protein
MIQSGDIRFAKARQLKVPIQRVSTKCLLVLVGRILRSDVFPFALF